MFKLFTSVGSLLRKKDAILSIFTDTLKKLEGLIEELLSHHEKKQGEIDKLNTKVSEAQTAQATLKDAHASALATIEKIKGIIG